MAEQLEDRLTPAAPFPEFIDPNPAPGNQFGASVTALSTGNVVITSPGDDAGGTDTGAVYLFSGATGALISTLRGSKAGDLNDTFATALTNGNFVIYSRNWDNGAVVDAGAATFGNGTTGISGVISPANSLVGSITNDFQFGGVAPLTNGNYVVSNPSWDNGAVMNVGAVTFGNGTTGIVGVVSPTNSLVGSSTDDIVGSGLNFLANGNYVVNSHVWDNGAVVDAGAVTFGNGTTGIVGVVSPTNSLVGSTAKDQVGEIVQTLTNGNYVVGSYFWDNGAVADVGAVTFGNGTTGIVGVVTAANSLVGSSKDDEIGTSVTPLTNGNYVVRSVFWDNGAIKDAGAVTFGNGTTGIIGVVSAANSLVGSSKDDRVGTQGVAALTNGNYVVGSPFWNNGAVVDAGAATFGNGTTGIVGVVSAANSLVGINSGNGVGDTVTPLTNGNYVVSSTDWDNGAVLNVGAATFGNGTTGVIGVVSAANSLIGSTAQDRISEYVTPLTNGNYVVSSPGWKNGVVANAGAATFGNGTTGIIGVVSAANSLVGTTASDDVGGADDGVGALANGNYVVKIPFWDNGAVVNSGAVTFGNGTTGISGAVSPANSLVGTTASDFVGTDLGQNGPAVFALPNGNYFVNSSWWDNGSLQNAGAITFGSGTTGVVGPIPSQNSVFGLTANAGLKSVGVDNVNGTYFGSFLTEGGGRVRVGSQVDGFLPNVNLSVSANAGTEAEGTVITVTATANAPVTGDATITLSVTGAGITAGDYTLSNATITIPNGQTTGRVTFTVRNDAEVEGVETATLSISNISANLAPGATTTQAIAITDGGGNPPPPNGTTPLAVGGANGSVAVFAASSGQYASAATVTPFAGFTGGVRTATADVDGDGIADTIAVTGPGTPIRVAVVSGADNSTVLVAPFDPFGGDFTGGGFVAAADIDRDGKAEFVVTPDQGGGPRVSIFGRNADGTVATRGNFFGIDDPNFRGGARSALGDVNGDGTPDLAVSAGFLGGPRTALFDGTTLLGTPTRLISDFFAFPGTDAETLRNGVFVAAGDVDGDGKAELIFGGGPGGAPRAFILGGALVSAGDVAGAQASPVANFFVAGNDADRGGVRLAVKNADADAKADVIAGSGEGSPSKVRIYLGANFSGASEPVTFQDLDPFAATLPGGVFVG